MTANSDVNRCCPSTMRCDATGDGVSTPICRAPASAPVSQKSRYPTGKPAGWVLHPRPGASGQTHLGSLGEFAPHWIFPGPARIQRHVSPYPLSSDESRYQRLKDDLVSIASQSDSLGRRQSRLRRWVSQCRPATSAATRSACEAGDPRPV